MKPYSILTQHNWGFWDIYCCLAVDEQAARDYIKQEVGQPIIAVMAGHKDEYDFAEYIGRSVIL